MAMYNGWFHANLECFALQSMELLFGESIMLLDRGMISRELQLKLMDPAKTLANHVNMRSVCSTT
jgi:hypothetical protein